MKLSTGARIRMIAMGVDPRNGKPDPHPIEAGDTGTVLDDGHELWGDRTVQHSVKWDSGRNLGIIIPVDTVEVIDG
jgi:hypothetical protein